MSITMHDEEVVTRATKSITYYVCDRPGCTILANVDDDASLVEWRRVRMLPPRSSVDLTVDLEATVGDFCSSYCLFEYARLRELDNAKAVTG